MPISVKAFSRSRSSSPRSSANPLYADEVATNNWSEVRKPHLDGTIRSLWHTELLAVGSPPRQADSFVLFDGHVVEIANDYAAFISAMQLTLINSQVSFIGAVRFWISGRKTRMALTSSLSGAAEALIWEWFSGASSVCLLFLGLRVCGVVHDVARSRSNRRLPRSRK